MKNKIIKILFLFVFSLFFISISSYVFAFDSVTFGYNIDGEKLEFPDIASIPVEHSYDNFVIFKRDGLITLLFTNYYKLDDNLNGYNPSFTGNGNLNVRGYERYDLIDNNWTYKGYSSGISIGNNFSNVYFKSIYYSTIDLRNIIRNDLDEYPIVYFSDNEYGGPSFKNPFFVTTSEELSSGKFTLKINAGDLSYNINSKFYLHIDEGYDIGDGTFNYIRKKSYCLDQDSSYWLGDGITDFYHFPSDKLGIDLSSGKAYSFVLSYSDEIYDSIKFQVGNLSPEDEEKNKDDYDKQLKEEQNKKLDETNKQLEEQNKTNKNIFEKIGDIFNILNPFSKDFFAYKLVDLFLNMLKSLFIPSDDFFTNWIDDINTYFGDTFGILYYPFELLIKVLNKISSLNDSTSAVINIPEFKLMDTTLLGGYTYDFNSILSNDTFKQIHDVYLYIVDVILWLGCVLLCKNFIKFIFGGIDDSYNEITTDLDVNDTSYKNYSKHQENKQRYKQEHRGGNR